jgi:hypothetical protein
MADGGCTEEGDLRRSLVWLASILTLLLAISLTAPIAAAGSGASPNQGNPDMVLTVDNPCVSCGDPVPGPKIEGYVGRYLFVVSFKPIEQLTIKSGRDASVVWSYFGDYWMYGKHIYFAKVMLSKDISNYVVWTCHACGCGPW